MKKTDFIRSLLLAVIVFIFLIEAKAQCDILEVQKGQGFISMFQEMKVCIKTHNKKGSMAERILKTNAFNLSLQKGFLIKKGDELKSPIIPLHSTLFFDKTGNLCFRSGKTGVSKIIFTVDEQSITLITKTVVTSPIQKVTKNQLHFTFDKNNSIQGLSIEEEKVSDSVSTSLVSFITTLSFKTKEKNDEKFIEPAKIEKTKTGSKYSNVNINVKTEKFYWDSLAFEAYKKQIALNLLNKKNEEKVRRNDYKTIKLNKKNTKERKKLEKSYWDSLTTDAHKKQIALNLLNKKNEEKVRRNDCKTIKLNKKTQKKGRN